MNAADLRAFEADIAEAYNRGEIRAPIHLSAGTEDALIAYFAAEHRPGDWVLSNWRSHYHALLAGVPAQEVRAAIVAGRSIALAFPEHRFLASAIVGGALPIAVGLALAAKRGRAPWKVHVFCGDMTATTGAFFEAVCYAVGHSLPVHFICEDNSKSVGTPTNETWGPGPIRIEGCEAYVTTIEHGNHWPHSGAGRFVNF